MTAPQRATNTRDTAAATGFMAFLALAGGVAGLLIAACAVGIEQSWSGRRGTAPAREQQRRVKAADYRTWLARDAATQAAWRQARRDWWESGADPATKPEAPSVGRRAGTSAWRAWARLAVFTGDFRDGWRAGWQTADKVRRDGGRFKDIASARPNRDDGQATPETAEPAGSGTPADSSDKTHPQEGANPVAEPRNCPTHNTPMMWMHLNDGVETEHCEACDIDAHTRNPWKNCVPAGGDNHKCPNCGSTLTLPSIMCQVCNTPVRWCCNQVVADRPCPTCGSKSKYDNTDNNPKETTMADTATTTVAAPQSDTNAGVMAAHLDSINAGNQQISDLTDQLAALRAAQETKIRQANEFAESTGQTAQTKTALDAAEALATQLGQHLGAFSGAAEQATEETNAAREGLAPVITAEDTLAQAGADGRAVAQASNA